MRAVVQRVSSAEVTGFDGELLGSVGKGLVVFLGVGRDDDRSDIEYLADKILNLRVFEDEHGRMNRSVLEEGGGLLVVSQFTLYGDCRKGRRPSFSEAAPPEVARPLYEDFVERVRGTGIGVASGRFQAMMNVRVVNSGPVTILIDSKRRF
jgi:D-tyrosyl-tRNA(Tyr) deacylase